MCARIYGRRTWIGPGGGGELYTDTPLSCRIYIYTAHTQCKIQTIRKLLNSRPLPHYIMSRGFCLARPSSAFPTRRRRSRRLDRWRVNQTTTITAVNDLYKYAYVRAYGECARACFRDRKRNRGIVSVAKPRTEIFDETAPPPPAVVHDCC